MIRLVESVDFIKCSFSNISFHFILFIRMQATDSTIVDSIIEISAIIAVGTITVIMATTIITVGIVQIATVVEIGARVHAASHVLVAHTNAVARTRAIQIHRSNHHRLHRPQLRLKITQMQIKSVDCHAFLKILIQCNRESLLYHIINE